MSTKTIRWILLVVGVLLIVLAFVVKGQDRSFYIHWDYYPALGSPDVVKLKVYEVTADTLGVRIMSDSINVEWTTHRFTIHDDGAVHYFVMTAIDTAGNESEYSNFGVLDLGRPSKVLNVHITQ
jgi:hypothetical protein